MASIGHVAVGLAAARLLHRPASPSWPTLGAMAVWSLVSLLPDADVIGFPLGVAYGDSWGHRGATHSVAFALACGVAAAAFAQWRRRPAVRIGLAAFVVVGSHGLLDSLTDGGLGSALLWPLSAERYFAPWTPIPVAPIGLGFLSSRGLRVALAEAALFAPLLAYALWPVRHQRLPP